ncbi:MAG: TIGR02285 family protein [Pseudomonadota bacterium]
MPLIARLLAALPQVLLILLAAWSGVTRAEPREQIVWTVRDMPPFNILEGPLKGQGIADRLLELIRGSMPQYEHVNTRVNRARANQMLNGNVLACDPGLLWSKERAQIMHFSIPTMGLMTNGVVIRKQQEAELAAFVQADGFDLQAFIADERYSLGTLVERSYGPVIDAELARAEPDRLLVHHGNNASLSLLRMQQHGRLTAVLGYWPEVRYLADNDGIDLEQLRFYSVKGVPTYQLAYITCSKTPQGLKAIAAINQQLLGLREGQIIDLYARWLDEPTRVAYLEAAKRFFKQ